MPRPDRVPLVREVTGNPDHPTCDHTWILDRPESDTWQCLACGTEGNGTGPA